MNGIEWKLGSDTTSTLSQPSLPLPCRGVFAAQSGVDPYMVVQFGTMKPFKSKIMNITGTPARKCLPAMSYY